MALILRNILFYFNADQVFNPYTWKPPIHWDGYIGGKKVSFIQISDSAVDLQCFDWSGFPSELDDIKEAIRRSIDKAMKTMD